MDTNIKREAMGDGFPVVDFSITTPLESLRLMEVSTDVLEVIKEARDRSDGNARLKFKSFPPSADVPSTSRLSNKIKDGVLYLCSDDKAWAIRQVSTSNSVYIVQSGQQQDSNSNGTDTSSEVVMGGTDEAETTEKIVARGELSAIAKVSNFLELQPVTIDEREVEGMILRLLPIFEHPASRPESIATVSSIRKPKPILTRQALKDDIPAPTIMIAKALAKLAVFDHPDEDLRCYIPSPHTLLHSWTKLVEGCTIESIPLDHKETGLNVERIFNVVDDELDRVIVQTMLKKHGMFDALGMITTHTNQDHASESRIFDPEKLTLFIASLMLACEIEDTNTAVQNEMVHSTSSTSMSSSIPAASFLRRLSNNLPSSFLQHATQSTLHQLISSSPIFQHLNVSLTATSTSTKSGNAPHHPKKTDDQYDLTITWPPHSSNPTSTSASSQSDTLGCGITSYIDLVTLIDRDSHESNSASAGSGTATAPAKAAAGGKRKWHEKFAASRNKK